MIVEMKFPLQVFYQVECDSCEDLFLDQEGDDMFSSKKEAKNLARAAEWDVGNNGQCLCPGCKD